MPIQWNRDKNSYLTSCFRALKLGPYATERQIVEQATKRAQELAYGISERDAFDEHAIREASTKLRIPSVRVEEVLLSHSPPLNNQERLKSLLNKFAALAQLPDDRPDLELIHPLAVLWFLPAPDPEDFEFPKWEEFGLGQSGDSADLGLDVVFDN